MDSRRWTSAAIWIGIPLLFALFCKLTYWLAEARVTNGFFPSETYWLIAIALHVTLGLGVCLWLYGWRRKLLTIGYVSVMPLVLLAIQGTGSCLSGDCF